MLWEVGLQGSMSGSRQTRWDLISEQRRDDSVLDQSGSVEGENWLNSGSMKVESIGFIGGLVVDLLWIVRGKESMLISRFLVQVAGKVESGYAFTTMAMTRRGAGLLWGRAGCSEV